MDGKAALGCGAVVVAYFVYRDWARRSRPDFELKLREKRQKEREEKLELLKRLQAQQRQQEAVLRAQSGGPPGGGAEEQAALRAMGQAQEPGRSASAPGGQEQVSPHVIDQILQQLLHLGKAYAQQGDFECAAKKLRYVAKLIQQQGIVVAHGIFKQHNAPPEAHKMLDTKVEALLNQPTSLQELILEIKADPIPPALATPRVEEAD